MRAKEYYNLLLKCENSEAFTVQINDILRSFILEIETLIKIRNAKSIEACASIVQELNKKWVLFVSLIKKNNINTYDIDISEESFYEKVVVVVPEFKRFVKIKQNEPKPSEDKTDTDDLGIISPYKVIPLNEITKDNITKEILCCMGALGQYSKFLPVEYLRGLVSRISLLRYWHKSGIDHNDILPFETNRVEFFKNKKIDF
jgi:hypothetical protein